MFSLRELSYTFPGNRVRAVDCVSLDLEPGRIHAIVGENGAGKSTLARLCTGHLEPQSGSLVWDGVKRRFASPREALDAGVALVPQHPRLAAGLAVWQNLLLGRSGGCAARGRFGHVDAREACRRLSETLAAWDIRVPLEHPAERLDAAHVHWTAIAEALVATPRLLILDEPSAPYAPEECDRLYRLLRTAATRGMAVAVITHRLSEVLSWTDTCHVLRHGQLVGSEPITPELTIDRLVALMFGGAPAEQAAAVEANVARPPVPAADAGLVIRDLSAADGPGRAVHGINFQVAPGEIAAVVGLKDQGIELFEDLLAGFVPPRRGSMSWNGQPLSALGDAGRAYVPGRRFQRGIAPGLDIRTNFMARLRSQVYPRGLWSRSADLSIRERFRASFGRDWDAPVVSLSGGMIQRLIYERELGAPSPKLVICAEPWWGLDRQRQAQCSADLAAAAAAGAAVLVISSDLDEALALADRVAVMHRGRITMERRRSEALRAELAQAMVHHSREAAS